MRKLFSMLLTAALVLSCLSLSALAAPAYDGQTVLLYTANLRGDVTQYAAVAAVKAQLEGEGADVVLVDAGNYLQGSAAANSDRGLTVYNLMDAVGYDAAAMGLAEFSYGDATTGMVYHGNVTRYHTQKDLQEGCAETEYNVNRDGSVKGVLAEKAPAGFQALAANVVANEAYYSFAPSAVIETEGGLKLGVYGVTDPATVCLTNAPGYVSSADITVDGSSGACIVGAYLINNATKEITSLTVTPDKTDAAILAAAEAAKESAAPVVAVSEIILSGKDSIGWQQETNLGDLTADALRWYAENYMDGIDTTLPIVAIQNGGNCDQFIYPGEITETDLLRALPFSPMGVGVIQLTGAQLLETLESAASPSQRYGEVLCPGFAQVSGLSYTLNRNEDYDGGEAYGNFYRADSVTRVTINEVAGAAFDPEGLYNVVADNYIINGNDTYYVMSEAREAGALYVNNGNGVKTRDIVAMYLQNVLGGTVGEAYAAPQGRITVIEKSPFSDVKYGSYYFDAVVWANENGISNGVGDGLFAPDNACTVGQFVEFLRRASGSELPEALTEGIDPDAELPRGWAVRMLYLWAEGKTGEGTLPFADVTAEMDIYDAVLWAYEAGVTKGVSDDSFAPDDGCTRGQALTLLYRLLAK